MQNFMQNLFPALFFGVLVDLVFSGLPYFFFFRSLLTALSLCSSSSLDRFRWRTRAWELFSDGELFLSGWWSIEFTGELLWERKGADFLFSSSTACESGGNH